MKKPQIIFFIEFFTNHTILYCQFTPGFLFFDTLKPEEHVPESKHTESILNAKVKVTRPGAERQKRMLIFFSVALLMIIVLAFLLFRPEPETMTVRNVETALAALGNLTENLELSGVVNTEVRARVRVPGAGIIDSIQVGIGDQVMQGDLIAVMTSQSLLDDRTDAEQELRNETRTYQSLILTRELEILQEAEQKRGLERTLESAEEALDEARNLFNSGSISDNDLRQAEYDLEDAQTALQIFARQSEISAQQFNFSKLSLEERLEELNSTLSEINALIEATEIRAPINGKIIDLIDPFQALGEELDENTLVAEIADTSRPLIETTIEEQYLQSVTLNQPVLVQLTNATVTGQIVEIGLLAETPSDGGTPVVDLRIQIPGNLDGLIPGSSALIEVVIGEIEDTIILPRGAFLNTGNLQYLYIKEGNKARRVKVSYGSISDTEVQVISGLEAGQEVIISSYQSFIDFEEIQIRNK
jgi:HlyD family secretion protein